MSVSRSNGPNGGHFYSNAVQPVLLSLNFVVDSANGNGLGLRSLKSNGYVSSVFMHTSATPGTVEGELNPNPANGFAIINLKNNYNAYMGGFSGMVSPVTGSALTSVTNHSVYVIVSLGTTTAAQWLAAGVPAGIVPAVGVAFVATKTGAIGGSGAVKAPGVSGITAVEIVGDSNLGVSSNIATYNGQQIIVQFLAPSSSSVTTLVPTAPLDGSVVGMSILLDRSSVTIDGL